jgi:serine/threonine-protein kinase mTOR
VEVWQRILQVRTLVLSPDDDPVMWIKFANLCRKNDRIALAEKTINSILSPIASDKVCLLAECLCHHTESSLKLQMLRDSSKVRAPPGVVYAQLKLTWANGAKEETLGFLRNFTETLLKDLESESMRTDRPGSSKQRIVQLSELLARCYYKQGQWQESLMKSWTDVCPKFSNNLPHLLIQV